MHYASLNKEVRQLMLAEATADSEAGRTFISPRLTPQGVQAYPGLLCQALESHDDKWLEEQLNRNGMIKETELRKGKPVKVPHTAARSIAEGEFNRMYIRGLCLDVIAKDDSQVTIYRAKPVDNPRPESEARIGRTVDAKKLLADLRQNIGIETALGVPNGVNSGLSVRRS